MAYKLVALDIDGTLLNKQGKLTPRVKAVIQRAQQAGVIVTVATGRRLHSALPIIIEAGIDAPVILHNGALVIHPFSRDIISHLHLPRKAALEAIKFIHQSNLTALVHSSAFNGEDIYYEIDPENEIVKRYFGKNNPHLHKVQDLRTYLTWDPLRVVSMDSYERLLPLYREFEERFPFERALIFTEDTYTDIWILEVLHPACSKAAGVKALAAHYGFTREEILTVGDNLNDIEMVRYAGLGVAMANSLEEVKAAADLVISTTNEEDGVAEVFERYVLGRGA